MINEFKDWLVGKGFSLFTAKNFPSTVFDYLTGIKYVCQWENKTVEELADSISDIYPKYADMGEHSVRGRMKSRAVRCGLRQFNKFIMESKGI